LLARSSNILENIKCPYLVTFDLDCEHILAVDASDDHCVKVIFLGVVAYPDSGGDMDRMTLDTSSW